MNWAVSLLSWSSIIFLWAVFAAAAVSYIYGKTFSVFNFKFLVIAVVAFRLLYVFMAAAVQYYVWFQSDFTKNLVNSPLSGDVPVSDFILNNFGWILGSNWGYFLFYSWGHFVVNVVVLFTVALIFYAILRALRRYNDRFFRDGEIELGLLLSLIVGWPNFVLFVPIIFIFVVLVSVFRLLRYKEPYTTLGLPMLLSSLLVMVFGEYLIEVAGLSVLII